MDTSEIEHVVKTEDTPPKPYDNLMHWSWFWFQAIGIGLLGLLIIALLWYVNTPLQWQAMASLVIVAACSVIIACLWWMWKNRPRKLDPESRVLRVFEGGPDNILRVFIGDSGVDSFPLGDNDIVLEKQNFMQKAFFRSTYSVTVSIPGKDPRTLRHVVHAKQITTIVEWGSSQGIKQQTTLIDLNTQTVDKLDDILTEAKATNTNIKELKTSIDTLCGILKRRQDGH